jgi:methionyl-tRNA formyltransferase
VKTVFFGTPEIAVPALDALTQISEVRGVVCQPDRPAGRGMQCRAPAVKSWAVERGLALIQPEKVRDGQLQRWLSERDVDVAVVLAYGRILPQDVLATPKCGCMNLHASLLPRHRGAAPIQWSILCGDASTGISLMQMDEGLDTGPIYSRHPIAIEADSDAGALTERLARLAADVVHRDLRAAVAGELPLLPQDATSATFAPPIRHEDQILDFTQSALSIERRIRALSPKPGAYTCVRQRRLKVHAARVVSDSTTGPPGTVMLEKRRILVATGQGSLELKQLQIEGKATQSAADAANGRILLNGDLLGVEAFGATSPRR